MKKQNNLCVQSISGLFNLSGSICKEDKKSPEVIAKEIRRVEFKTKMCARTIRNNIYRGDIYDIKSSDMIYTKEYKEKK